MGINKDVYNIQPSGGWIDRLILRKRIEMFEQFNTLFPPDSFNSLLDVGATADRNNLNSNFLEQLLPDKSKITALSNQDASFLEMEYPGLNFIQGDALNMPFENNAFDVVFSSAVIEHVGSKERQLQMLRECYRVCRKGMFITTPNKWYPIEFHTLLPFVHWFPSSIKNWLFKVFGLSYFAQEENLNLLQAKDFVRNMELLGVERFEIRRIKLFSINSNLLLVVTKP